MYTITVWFPNIDDQCWVLSLYFSIDRYQWSNVISTAIHSSRSLPLSLRVHLHLFCLPPCTILERHWHLIARFYPIRSSQRQWWPFPHSSQRLSLQLHWQWICWDMDAGSWVGPSASLSFVRFNSCTYNHLVKVWYRDRTILLSLDCLFLLFNFHMHSMCDS